MRQLLIFGAFLLLGGFPAHSQDLAGEWQGTLKAGATELRLVLHISHGRDGQINATLDSVDQDANDIRITSISLKDSHLKFTIEAIHASYDGTINADKSEIAGTWTQIQPLPLDFKRKDTSKHNRVSACAIEGTWLGRLEAGALKLRMVFHIASIEHRLMATLDSPDQNARGIPVTDVRCSGNSLILELQQIEGSFRGTISSDLTAIQGAWTQAATSSPLDLKRVSNAAELQLRRPQNPEKPYPYRELEVSYPNRSAGISLAGTLTIPKGKGPFPAVVLITGSGPQDRDEALMGHRPFLVLADYLTRRGIAVLRADDRGVGQSTGNFSEATSADFATDTEAGITFLKGRPEIDSRRIGLIGHSEGGLIAPMIAARNRDVFFIVLMAGPGVPGEEILLEQNRLIAQTSGENQDQVEEQVAQLRALLDVVKGNQNDDALNVKVHQQLEEKMPDAQIGADIRQMSSPWFRYFITYDPASALKKVRCPVLAIDGEKDLQVSPDQNLPAIRNALDEGRNKDHQIVTLPGLNHLFQTAKTGLPSEYGEIEETISPVALETIANWIAKHERGK